MGLDVWVWDFEKWVWMFEEGEEEGKTVLGRHMEKKKGEKERRKKMVYRNSSLRDLSSTWIFSPPQLC